MSSPGIGPPEVGVAQSRGYTTGTRRGRSSVKRWTCDGVDGLSRASSSMGAVIRRIWAWAVLTVTVRPNRTCPVCGRPVVAPPDYHVGRQLGPVIVRRTDAEISACCPVHGISPFNNDTVVYERRRDRVRAT